MAFRILVLDWLVAIAVAALLLPASQLLAPAATVPLPGHGEHFAAMARDPWAFDGAFPHRVLWPAAAHVAGMFGIGPVAFSHGCNGALLAGVFWFCRRRGASWGGAALVAAAVAASGAVLVYQTMACLSDPWNLLLLLPMVHFVARPAVFWSLAVVAATSHEMAFCFAPWFVWLRRSEGGGRLGRELAWCGGALAVYGAFRVLVATLAPPAAVGTYGLAYYFANNFWVPWGMPAMWCLLLLAVVGEFSLLVLPMVVAWRRGEHGMGGRAGPWLFVGCTLLLALLAYDVMRFATFAFLPVVLASLSLLRTPRGAGFVAVATVGTWVAAMLQDPLPTEYGGRVFDLAARHVYPLLGEWMQEAGLQEPRQFTPAEAAWFAGELFARAWPAWLGAAAAVVAMLFAAPWFARYVGTASAAGSSPRTQRNASP